MGFIGRHLGMMAVFLFGLTSGCKPLPRSKVNAPRSPLESKSSKSSSSRLQLGLNAVSSCTAPPKIAFQFNQTPDGQVNFAAAINNTPIVLGAGLDYTSAVLLLADSFPTNPCAKFANGSYQPQFVSAIGQFPYTAPQSAICESTKAVLCLGKCECNGGGVESSNLIRIQKNSLSNTTKLKKSTKSKFQMVCP